jgi:DNA-directed RNA polymerase beta' subunit
MVLGIYYLTQERPGAMGEGKTFKNLNEAILAYENQVITLHVLQCIPRGSLLQLQHCNLSHGG